MSNGLVQRVGVGLHCPCVVAITQSGVQSTLLPCVLRAKEIWEMMSLDFAVTSVCPLLPLPT